MSRSIIVGADGTSQATEAAGLAAALARSLDRQLVLAHVANDPPVFPYGDHWRRELQRRQLIREGGDLLSATASAIGEPSARRRIALSRLMHDTVEERLAMVSREEQADLLVLGSGASHPLARALFGGSAGSPSAWVVASLSACPVLVVPRGADRAEERSAPFGSVLCGIDGSVGSDRARVVAAGLAEGLGLQLMPISVERTHRLVEGEHVVRVLGRDPAATLAEVASRFPAPLIVVGMRGREVLSESVSRELAAMAPVPVLIVPHDARLPRFSPTRTVEPARAAA